MHSLLDIHYKKVMLSEEFPFWIALEKINEIVHFQVVNFEFNQINPLL